MLTAADPFESDIGAQTIETQQQTTLERGAVEVFPPGWALKQVGHMHPQVSFLEDVKQVEHGPALRQVGLELWELRRLCLRF